MCYNSNNFPILIVKINRCALRGVDPRYVSTKRNPETIVEIQMLTDQGAMPIDWPGQTRSGLSTSGSKTVAIKFYIFKLAFVL